MDGLAMRTAVRVRIPAKPVQRRDKYGLTDERLEKFHADYVSKD